MDDPINFTIKAKGKNRSGLQVELRKDGHYYISKVPRGTKDCSVGDRVLEINGAKASRFKGATHANELIDTFQLQILPLDDDDDDDQTTDDDFDLGTDNASSQAAARSVGRGAAQVAPKNSGKANGSGNGGAPPKKVPGRRRETVEYLEESDSEEEVPRGAKSRTAQMAAAGVGTRAAAAAAKIAPKKLSDRREEAATIDGEDLIAGKKQAATPPQKGRGRREEVEYLSDDDDDDDDDEEDDDDDADDDEDEEDYDDEESSDEESYEEVVRPKAGARAKTASKLTSTKSVPQSVRSMNDHDGSDSSGRNGNGNGPYPDPDESEDGEEDRSAEAYESDEDYEGDGDVQPQTPISPNARRHSFARRRDSDRALHRPSPKDFDRPYTSDYIPMDRWMVSVKKEPDEEVGISIVQHKKDLYVADVEPGPFYKTAVDRGDKILSINGKKVRKHIHTVSDAEEVMEGRTQLTVFVLRPDPEKDEGYRWVMQNFG